MHVCRLSDLYFFTLCEIRLLLSLRFPLQYYYFKIIGYDSIIFSGSRFQCFNYEISWPHVRKFQHLIWPYGGLFLLVCMLIFHWIDENKKLSYIHSHLKQWTRFNRKCFIEKLYRSHALAGTSHPLAWDGEFQGGAILMYARNELIYNFAISHSHFLRQIFNIYSFIIGELKYNFKFSAEFCDQGDNSWILKILIQIYCSLLLNAQIWIV